MANTFISLSSFRRGCRCRGGYPYRQESSGPEGRRCYDFYCQGHPGRRRRQAQDEVRRAAWCGTPYTERRGKHRVGRRRRREPGLPGQPSVPGRAEPRGLLRKLVYDRGERRLLLENGFVTFDLQTNTPSYHFYVRDRLGNNRTAARSWTAPPASTPTTSGPGYTSPTACSGDRWIRSARNTMM